MADKKFKDYYNEKNEAVAIPSGGKLLLQTGTDEPEKIDVGLITAKSDDSDRLGGELPSAYATAAQGNLADNSVQLDTDQDVDGNKKFLKRLIFEDTPTKVKRSSNVQFSSLARFNLLKNPTEFGSWSGNQTGALYVSFEKPTPNTVLQLDISFTDATDTSRKGFNVELGTYIFNNSKANRFLRIIGDEKNTSFDNAYLYEDSNRVYFIFGEITDVNTNAALIVNQVKYSTTDRHYETANWDSGVISDLTGLTLTGSFTVEKSVTKNWVTENTASASDGALARNSVQLTGAVSQSIDGKIELNDGGDRTIIGTAAGGTGTFQSVFGSFAGRDNSGDNQSAFGYQAGESNSSAAQSAFGFAAGRDNSGANQSALGVNAGRDNSGANQSVFGRSAGQLNTSSNQSAFGYFAGLNNIGNDQSVFGSFAGRDNSGANQSALGVNAGRDNSGDFNIAIGSDSSNGNSGDNVLTIGNQAGLNNTQSNRTIIDNDLVPAFASNAAAIAAINIAGVQTGMTYVYFNTSNNAIEAVRT
jgi:hypothetical protein